MYLSGKVLSCSKNIMFTTAGGKENLTYSRIPSLVMGLDADGKSRKNKGVQNAFPSIPSQLPTVISSVTL